MRSQVWGGVDYPVTQPYNPGVHAGIDIGCPTGTTIYGARAGVVERVQTGMVAVRVAGSSLRDFYLHGTSLVSVGQAIAMGQPVIRSGAVTVDPRYPVTGPHLHFECENGYQLPAAPPYANEAPLDPVPILLAAQPYLGSGGSGQLTQEDDMVFIGARHPKVVSQLRIFAAGSSYRIPVADPHFVFGPIAEGATIGVDAYCYSTSGVASPDLSGAVGAQPGTDYCWWHATSGQWVPDAIVDTSKLAGAPAAAIPAGEPMQSLFPTREEVAQLLAGLPSQPIDTSTLATKDDVAAVAAKIPTKVSITGTLSS